MTIRFSARPLSVLRKAARGEPVAALLDPEQTAALAQLPFADQLEVVAESPPLVAGLVCGVGGRLASGQRESLTRALLDLHQADGGPELLEALRMKRFEPLAQERLSGAERAYAGGGG